MGTIHSEVLRLQREMELSIQEKNYALAIAKSRQLLEMMVDDLTTSLTALMLSLTFFHLKHRIISTQSEKLL